MLVKEMGAHGGTVGSTDAGIRAMVADLATRGMPTDGLELHDGSGLSRENRATCKLLDALLTADGTQGQIVLPRKDSTIQAGLGFGYDGTRYKSFGPHGGQALSVNLRYLPDLKDGGSLSEEATAEARAYVPISRRTNLAFRAFGGYSSGSVPSVYAFGGLDNMRGYDYRALIGNRIAYLNAEFRFPLIDVLITGIGLNFGGVRGRVFFDVGGAWLENEDFRWWQDGRLKDGRAAWGAGFTTYFLGIPWNVDFARPFDGKSNLGGWKTTFYVGPGSF